MARFTPLYPSWVVKNPKLLREARKQIFRSQKEVDAWVAKEASKRGKTAYPYHLPKQQRNWLTEAQLSLYGHRHKGKKTAQARYLNPD